MRKNCAVPRTRSVVRSMLHTPMPADSSASDSASWSNASSGEDESCALARRGAVRSRTRPSPSIAVPVSALDSA